MNRLTLDKQARLFALLVEGNSMRGITRLEDVTLNTVLRNSVWMGEACQKFHDTHVRDLKITNLQADELTSFIYAKDKNLPDALKDDPEFGSMWTWVSIGPESYFIPAWHIGKREMIDAFTFAHDLAGRIPGRVQITTDQLRHYYTAFLNLFLPGHARIHEVQPRAMNRGSVLVHDEVAACERPMHHVLRPKLEDRPGIPIAQSLAEECPAHAAIHDSPGHQEVLEFFRRNNRRNPCANLGTLRPVVTATDPIQGAETVVEHHDAPPFCAKTGAP